LGGEDHRALKRALPIASIVVAGRFAAQQLGGRLGPFIREAGVAFEGYGAGFPRESVADELAPIQVIVDADADDVTVEACRRRQRGGIERRITGDGLIAAEPTPCVKFR
jgi:hypothetical protein